MLYSLLAPGKRLRPALVVLAAEACADANADPWPAACAVEMIHAYSLIHDDLPAMDDDDLRRGLPTCHKKFGEALAILAGDALQTLAFQVLAESYPPATAAACCKELARAAGPAGMIGGQVDDMAWDARCATAVSAVRKVQCENTADTAVAHVCPSDTDWTLETLERLHARKTGARSAPVSASAPWPPMPRRRRRPRRWSGSTATAGGWGWPFRSLTTCWTWKAPPTAPANAWGRTPPAAS